MGIIIESCFCNHCSFIIFEKASLRNQIFWLLSSPLCCPFSSHCSSPNSLFQGHQPLPALVTAQVLHLSKWFPAPAPKPGDRGWLTVTASGDHHAVNTVVRAEATSANGWGWQWGYRQLRFSSEAARRRRHGLGEWKTRTLWSTLAIRTSVAVLPSFSTCMVMCYD